jgi:flagellar motor switch protein FliG
MLELYDRRPDVAESVLSEICLETACTTIPKSVLANAIHRTPMDALTTFLRGTREEVVSRVLEGAPRQKRDDLHTELSLDVPVGKSEFLSARERFMDVVRESIRREGHDLVEANLEALRQSTSATPQQGEVAE